MTRYAIKRVVNFDKTEIWCIVCRKSCKGERSLKSHITQMHSSESKETSHRGRPMGIPAWNKGVRSKPDHKNPEYVGRHGGFRAKSGRSKKFDAIDSYGNPVLLQSSYELECSIILNKLNIEWCRPKSLKYDGRNYFADFYLPKYDIYLDPKNPYKAKLDEAKIKKVIEQNNVKVFVLLKDNISEEYISSLIAISDGE